MINICIIIPVRNRREFTQQILTQLHAQIAESSAQFNPNANLQIIVVDDGSTDGTPELIETQFKQVKLLRGDGSLWWAGAIVQGMTAALETNNLDYIVWLNDDIVIAKDFIAALKAICISGKYKSAIAGGIVTDKTYPDWIVYGGVKRGKPISNINYFSEASELEVDFLCGNIVLIPRNIVSAIGLPDAIKLPHHGSDYDYTMRARKAGFTILLTDQLQASTNFQLTDFIRYMPYWMQWYLQPDYAKKWEVIKGLRTLKANQNIWLMVNLHSSNHDKKQIAQWRYAFCYVNKLFKLLAIQLMPKQRLLLRIQHYLDIQNPPEAIANALINQARLHS